MTITLKNFGPIKELTMDLTKNLHLLYGESSVGKSYAAYCVYLLLHELRKLLWEGSFQMLAIDDIVESLFTQLLGMEREQGKEEVDISGNIAGLLYLGLGDIIGDRLHPVFRSTFGSSLEQLDNQFTGKHFSLTLATTVFQAEFALDNKRKIFILSNFTMLVPLIAKYDSQAGNGGTCGFDEQGRCVAKSQKSFASILRTFTVGYVHATLQHICSQIYFLPASHLGLYQMHTSFSPIIAELAGQRFGLQSKLQLPSLTALDSDYIQQLAQIQIHEVTSPLTDLAERIEREVVKGSVQFEAQTKRIIFQPKDTKIWQEISHVSSMVAALAPFVLFLKYILTSHETAHYRTLSESALFQEKMRFAESAIMLIFEEPEAHLHPTAQVKLMEILAELTKYNVRVMLTSHSNYMFNKLGNMVLGGEIDETTIQTHHLVMTDEGSIDAGDMKLTKDEITDENFAEVSEQLYDERVRLYDKLNAEVMHEFEN